MPRHKFENTTFVIPQFATKSAILSDVPYSPEAMIIGTFNPDIDGNQADFFYGRNYFWRIFENFSRNNNNLNGKRITDHEIRQPDLNRILELCTQFKLTFADLILGTLQGVVIDNYQDSILNQHGNNNSLISNTVNIIKYLNEKKSITHVYLTTKPSQLNYINGLWQNVVNGCNRDIAFRSILTPSAQGLGQNINGLHRAGTLARYWVWCNHPKRQIQRQGFHHFDHQWLKDCGVEIDNF